MRSRQAPDWRIVRGIAPHEDDGMDKSAQASTRVRNLSHYWAALCAVLLFAIVVYAVLTAT